ncbi:hypothetical protein AK812_SmicGene2242 [Symbiodinium microadriaticum]|uniref:EB domain-containing protein n=1 Tax=Symbiodinium microadriaticum TaxID=2951 RepID=A0A1Q9F202_SYMMI|nr:hypothetical protein AK812_SmicGene2242 [Symbiodinium microadriaticum]
MKTPMWRVFLLWPAVLANEDSLQDARCSLQLLQLDGSQQTTTRRDDENGEPTAWGDASHGGRFTGGTCSLFGCDGTRGPTICHHFRCICQEGYVAMAGKCEPQSAGPVTALGTRTGESCSWLGYCTVEHRVFHGLSVSGRTRGATGFRLALAPVEEKPLSHSPRTKVPGSDHAIPAWQIEISTKKSSFDVITALLVGTSLLSISQACLCQVLGFCSCL